MFLLNDSSRVHGDCRGRRAAWMPSVDSGVAGRVLFEDGLDTFVTMGAEDERAGTGRIQSFIAVAFGQPQDPEAGTVTWLRVGSFS